MVMMLPVLPLIEVRLVGLSNGEVGMLLAVNSAALIVASRGWGAIAEQLKRLLPLFYLALAAMIGMALLYAFGRSFGLLLIANTLCGIGGGAIAIAWQAVRDADRSLSDRRPGGVAFTDLRSARTVCSGAGCAPGEFLESDRGTMQVAAGMLALGGLVLLPLKETASTSLAPEILPSLSEQEREP